MATKQVVTIDPDGKVSGLQVKKGRGLDLTKMGRAEVERVSEITWCADAQAWYVNVLSQKVRDWMTETWVDVRPEGEMLWTHWVQAKGRSQVLHEIQDTRGGSPSGCHIFLGRMFFGDYGDAVKAEVEFLNALRLKDIY